MTLPNTEARGPQGETAGKQTPPRAEPGDSGSAREQDQVKEAAKKVKREAKDAAKDADTNPRSGT